MCGTVRIVLINYKLPGLYLCTYIITQSLVIRTLEFLCVIGYSGADMATLCKEAGMAPIRNLLSADIEQMREADVCIEL